MITKKTENYNQTGELNLVCPICGGTEVMMKELSDTRSGGRTFIVDMSFYCSCGYSFSHSLKSEMGKSVIITDGLDGYDRRKKIGEKFGLTAKQVYYINKEIDKKLKTIKQ